MVRGFSTVIVSDQEGIVWEVCREGGDRIDVCITGLIPPHHTVEFVNVYVKFFHVSFFM